MLAEGLLPPPDGVLPPPGEDAGGLLLPDGVLPPLGEDAGGVETGVSEGGETGGTAGEGGVATEGGGDRCLRAKTTTISF